jgi:CRISPR-associated endonuclease/helicase Cas3
MSLDLSADLIVSQIAPIPALIQRLGRLNRRAAADDPWPFLVYGLDFDAKATAPYEPEDLTEAKAWLERLGTGGLSQRDLSDAWIPRPEPPRRTTACAWLDGGYETRARPLRQGSPGIEIILHEDADSVRSGQKPEEYRIPMLVPRDRDWHQWDEVAFCKVPPPGRVDYDPMRGARWTR